MPRLTPPTGQSPPLRHSVSTNVNPIRFWSDVGGPVPHGSGYAHPLNSVELHKGSGIVPEHAQAPEASAEAPEAAHASQLGYSGSTRASVNQQGFVREPEDEDDQESVVEFPVIDKTCNRLVNYICEQYPDSRPHSDPSVPPRCDFETSLRYRILRP